MANSKLDYSKALRDPNPQALRGCNSWAIDDDVDFLLELTIFIWNGNYERLEALFRFPQRSSQFEKCNLAMSKFPIKLCKNKHGSAPEIWNSKIPESKRTVFKKGKDFSISNRWNNFTQTPACDLVQNWLLAKFPSILVGGSYNVSNLPFTVHLNFYYLYISLTEIEVNFPQNYDQDYYKR